MKRLALLTWRLPHVGLARLEDSRATADGLAGRSDVFAFATCQRTIVCTLSRQPREVLDELGEERPAGAERYVGEEAFAHLARVAASLEALAPGEDQVPAQFSRALDEAEDELEPELLDRLQRVRALAREARDAGDLCGHASRSVLDLADPLLPQTGPVAVVGTGQIAREAVERLADRGVHVVSRERARAVELVDADRAWTRAAFLAGPPPLAGLVLSTCTDEEPVVDEAAIQRLVQARHGSGPLRVLDLGVPRNADPAIAWRDDVDVATMADLAYQARCRKTCDPQVEAARQALSEALARERRRRRRRQLDERVVRLRRALAEELEPLAEELPEDEDERLERANKDLAHTAQRHLEAAIHGEPPP